MNTSSQTRATSAVSVPAPVQAQGFALKLNAFGKLLLTDAAGQVHEDVVPVRAFPIAAPAQGVSLVNAEGRELVWIEQLDALAPETRRLIEKLLQAREFMPEILRLKAVSSFATPSHWEVDTDRGACRFTLKGEEDIRRLPGGLLLIADEHGVQYLLRQVSALDRHSRRLLDRFL